MVLQLNSLGKVIHYHRKQSGLSQADLAKLVGLSKAVIFNVEHGKSTIQLDTLLKIFDGLNIKLHLESSLMRQFEEDTDASS